MAAIAASTFLKAAIFTAVFILTIIVVFGDDPRDEQGVLFIADKGGTATVEQRTTYSTKPKTLALKCSQTGTCRVQVREFVKHHYLVTVKLGRPTVSFASGQLRLVQNGNCDTGRNPLFGDDGVIVSLRYLDGPFCAYGGPREYVSSEILRPATDEPVIITVFGRKGSPEITNQGGDPQSLIVPDTWRRLHAGKTFTAIAVLPCPTGERCTWPEQVSFTLRGW